MEKSDFIVYNHIAELQMNDKKINDSAYLYQMSKTIPKCLMDRDIESKLQKDIYKNRIAICGDYTKNRGFDMSCPHPEYSKYYMQDFLLVPCPKPTHKNYIVCDKDKCCSKNHQLFKNWTKRKSINL